MTTVSELKAMLREEIAEPLDYPRVPGLSAKELAEYNKGYRYACDLVLGVEPEWTDQDWLTVNLDCVPQFRVLGAVLTQRDRGKDAAYAWILGELKSIESERAEPKTEALVRCSCGDLFFPPHLTVPYGASIMFRDDIDGTVHRSPEPCYAIEADTITIPRARYNHLLEVEKSAATFVELFTRWES